jgi:putative transposase
MARAFPRRPLRLDFVFAKATLLFFVTFNTHERKPLLGSAGVHDSFTAFCTRAYDEFGVAVGRYVIMPDHVHAFVHLPEVGMELSRWVQSLRSVLGKTLLAAGHAKPHWQPGFFDHLIRQQESYAQKWEYVRMNPVRAGLCARTEEWPYQGEIVEVRF